MKHLSVSLLLAACIGASAPARAAGIDVMTQNQYVGADLAPVLDAATAIYPTQEAFLGAFSSAVVDALMKIAASRPADRTRALATEIDERHPDVVGLQEAYRFSCAPLLPAYPPCLVWDATTLRSGLRSPITSATPRPPCEGGTSSRAK